MYIAANCVFLERRLLACSNALRVFKAKMSMVYSVVLQRIQCVVLSQSCYHESAVFKKALHTYLTTKTFHPGDFVVIKPRGKRRKIPKPQIFFKVVGIGEVESKDQGKILLTNNDPIPKQWWEPATSLGLYAKHDEVDVIEK